jgi:hypothetical protein
MQTTSRPDEPMGAQPAAGHQPWILPRQLNPRVQGTERAGVQEG